MTTTKAKFAVYARHEDVQCFLCLHRGVSTEPVNAGHKESGYAAGQGAFQTGRCPRCEAITWYDLEPAQCPGCTDPGCDVHGIPASNARQNDYWRRVGGHD